MGLIFLCCTISVTCDTMDNIKKSCRLCLKLTSEVNLTPIFENYGYENVAMEWRRMFSFIYNIQGLPDKICSNCKAQAEWILNFHRQCYENDAILRMNQIKIEYHEQQNIHTSSNIYDKENSLDNGQIHETPQEFEYDTENFEKYDHQMSMEYSNETFVEEMPSNSEEQESLIEETVEAMQSEDETNIFEDQSKEESDHDQMANTIQEIAYTELTDEADIPERSLSIQSGSTTNCPICGKSFANTSNMNAHRKKHENPKPFACTFSGCDKKFSEKRMRDAHIKTIHEKRIYKCPACNYEAKYRHIVAKHILKEHRGTRLRPLELET